MSTATRDLIVTISPGKARSFVGRTQSVEELEMMIPDWARHLCLV